MFVPEDSCIVEKVDLATTNAYKIAGRMYYKHHPNYGAFVVRHKTRLPSQPKTTLRELTIRVFDQKLKKRRLGVYHLTNVARLADSEFTADTEFTEEWEGSTLCGDFVNMCQSRDKKLLKKLDQTNDSFGAAHSTRPPCVRNPSIVLAMPSTKKPPSSRRTAKIRGEWNAFTFVKTLVFVY